MRKLASSFVILLALYVCAYVFCVKPGVSVTFGGWHTTYPDYRWLPVPGVDTVFSPLHRLDRRYMRPALWAQPVTLAERRLIAGLAARQMAVAETWTPNQSVETNALSGWQR